jgi:hypothetical protein
MFILSLKLSFVSVSFLRPMAGFTVVLCLLFNCSAERGVVTAILFFARALGISCCALHILLLGAAILNFSNKTQNVLESLSLIS